MAHGLEHAVLSVRTNSVLSSSWFPPPHSLPIVSHLSNETTRIIHFSAVSYEKWEENVDFPLSAYG